MVLQILFKYLQLICLNLKLVKQDKYSHIYEELQIYKTVSQLNNLISLLQSQKNVKLILFYQQVSENIYNMAQVVNYLNRILVYLYIQFLYKVKQMETIKPDKPTIKTKDGRWSKKEHKAFVLAIKMYGKSWKLIQEQISTRTLSQIRSHAQKYFIRKQNCKYDSEQQSDQSQFVTPISSRPICRIQYQNDKEAELTGFNQCELKKQNKQFNLFGNDQKIQDSATFQKSNTFLNQKQSHKFQSVNFSRKKGTIQQNIKLQQCPSFFNYMIKYFERVNNDSILELIDLPSDEKIAKHTKQSK